MNAIVGLLHVLFALLICTAAAAQSGKKNPYMKGQGFKKNSNRLPWLNPKIKYARAGWLAEPGATWALGFKHDETALDENGGMRLHGTFKPGHRLGVYLGGGRYRIFPSGPVTYLDYGLAWKQLKAAENFNGRYTDDAGNTASEITGKGIFRENFALAHFNLNHVLTVGRFNFMQNTLGLNFDYRFMQRNEYEGGAPGIDMIAAPGAMRLNLHYKLGWGFRASKWLLVIPAVETPILNILPFEAFRSDYRYFNTRYRPLIFSVRFLFLRDAYTLDCPPVYGHPDDQQKEDSYRNF